MHAAVVAVAIVMRMNEKHSKKKCEFEFTENEKIITEVIMMYHCYDNKYASDNNRHLPPSVCVPILDDTIYETYLFIPTSTS